MADGKLIFELKRSLPKRNKNIQRKVFEIMGYLLNSNLLRLYSIPYCITILSLLLKGIFATLDLLSHKMIERHKGQAEAPPQQQPQQPMTDERDEEEMDPRPEVADKRITEMETIQAQRVQQQQQRSVVMLGCMREILSNDGGKGRSKVMSRESNVSWVRPTDRETVIKSAPT